MEEDFPTADAILQAIDCGDAVIDAFVTRGLMPIASTGSRTVDRYRRETVVFANTATEDTMLRHVGASARFGLPNPTKTQYVIKSATLDAWPDVLRFATNTSPDLWDIQEIPRPDRPVMTSTIEIRSNP